MGKNECNNKETRREDWGTPPWLFNELDGIFDFSFDLAASEDNTKCNYYLTKDEDFLSSLHDFYLQWFSVLVKSWCWCNPPYGKRGCEKWIDSIFLLPNTVSLIPASVGAKWFLKCWKEADAIVWLHKRLKFEGAPTGAQFDSCIVVKGKKITLGQLQELSNIGTVTHRGGIIDWKGTWFGDKK